MLLDGVHVPLTTPFYPDGRIYVRKLEHNVRRYSLTPVSGLIALADASEAASLGEAEQQDVLSAVAETAAADKVLTAALTSPGCEPALRLAEHAARQNFDVLLLAPPACWHGNRQALATWFRVLADRAPLPCLLSGRCGETAIDLDLLSGLAAHPNVLGVLEQSTHISRVVDLCAANQQVRRNVTTTITFTAATGRMLRPAAGTQAPAPGGFVSAAALASGSAVAGVAAVLPATSAPALRTRTKAVGVQVLWAHAADATEALRAGANGIATPVAAAVPQAVFEIWAAWKDGDHALMSEKQARVTQVEPALLAAGAPLIKAGAELSGYFGGRPRLPLVPPTAAEQADLATALHGMRS